MPNRNVPLGLKVMLSLQSVAIAILGLALYSDYLHNVYLRIYVDTGIQRGLIVYEVLIGLSFGMLLAFATTPARRKARPELRAKLGGTLLAIRALVSPARTSEAQNESRIGANLLSDSENIGSSIPDLPLLGTPLT